MSDPSLPRGRESTESQPGSGPQTLDVRAAIDAAACAAAALAVSQRKRKSESTDDSAKRRAVALALASPSPEHTPESDPDAEMCRVELERVQAWKKKHGLLTDTTDAPTDPSIARSFKASASIHPMRALLLVDAGRKVKDATEALAKARRDLREARKQRMSLRDYRRAVDRAEEKLKDAIAEKLAIEKLPAPTVIPGTTHTAIRIGDTVLLDPEFRFGERLGTVKFVPPKGFVNRDPVGSMWCLIHALDANYRGGKMQLKATHEGKLYTVRLAPFNFHLTEAAAKEGARFRPNVPHVYLHEDFTRRILPTDVFRGYIAAHPRASVITAPNLRAAR